MKYKFYTYPVVIKHPTEDKKYIVGVVDKGWIPYDEEVYNEIMKEWEETEKEKSKVREMNQPKEYMVASNSNPNQKYSVKRHIDGSWTCECRGFTYRKACSHIDKVKGNK